MESNYLDYKNKYLKYKNKYLQLKINGGSVPERLLLLIKDLLTKKFKNGNFDIFIKILKHDPADKDDINKLKICHHYSVFSLIDINKQKTENEFGYCCSFNSDLFKQTFNPICKKSKNEFGFIDEICDYSNILPSIIYKIPILPNIGERKNFKIRFYNDSIHINNTFYPHSARFEDGLLWHKFNGIPCLIAINTGDENIKNFGYTVTKELQIESYDVPNDLFINNENKAYNIKIKI